MSLRTLLRLTATLVLALGLMACGDDSSSEDGGDDGATTTTADADADLSEAEQEYVDEAVKGFDPEQEEGLTEDDARCVAASVVRGVGLDRLEDLGITPEAFNEEDLPSLEDAEAEDVVDRIEGCMDLRGLMLAGFTEDAELSDEARDCLEDAISDDLAHDLMVASISGEEASVLGGQLIQAVQECPGFEDLN